VVAFDLDSIFASIFEASAESAVPKSDLSLPTEDAVFSGVGGNLVVVDPQVLFTTADDIFFPISSRGKTSLLDSLASSGTDFTADAILLKEPESLVWPRLELEDVDGVEFPLDDDVASFVSSRSIFSILYLLFGQVR
jgi:hypothetical protein